MFSHYNPLDNRDMTNLLTSVNIKAKMTQLVLLHTQLIFV